MSSKPHYIPPTASDSPDPSNWVKYPRIYCFGDDNLCHVLLPINILKCGGKYWDGRPHIQALTYNISIGDLFQEFINRLPPPELRLDDLIDVQVPAPGHLNLLGFDAGSNQWVNVDVSGLVLSVNGLTRHVILTTAQIPETPYKLYYNRPRFLADLRSSVLNELSDVEIGEARNYDIFTYLNGMWRALPYGSNLYLENLIDVEYPDGVFGVNEQDETDTACWLIGFSAAEDQASVNPFWYATKLRDILSKGKLGHLSDVAGFDALPGQTLEWNGEAWVPGALGTIYTSDDVIEGSTNFYFTLNRLRNSYDIVGLNWLNDVSVDRYTDARVLAWDPITLRWTGVSAAIGNITTANVPEPLNTPPTYVPDYSTDTRVYFNYNRFLWSIERTSIGALGDVILPDEIQENHTLIWNSASRSFITGMGTNADSTDELREGSVNLYYLDSRVGFYLTTQSINIFEDVRIFSPAQVGQVLTYNEQNKWVNSHLTLGLEERGDLLIQTSNPAVFNRIPLGVEGQYLRVNDSASEGVAWGYRDPNYAVTTIFPDITDLPYILPRGKSGAFYYIGCDGDPGLNDWSPPTSIASGAPNVDCLYDRVYFSSDIQEDESLNCTFDPQADSVNLNAYPSITFDFQLNEALLATDIVIQLQLVDPYGARFIHLECSNNGATWYSYGNYIVSNIIELGETLNGVELLVNSAAFDGRKIFRLHLTHPPVGVPGDIIGYGRTFFRYYRLRVDPPAQQLEVPDMHLYEIEFYGTFNNGVSHHTLQVAELDKYLVTGLDNMVIRIPSNDGRYVPGWQCYVIASQGHNAAIEAASQIVTINSLNTGELVLLPFQLVKITNLSANNWLVSYITGGMGTGGGGEGNNADRLGGQLPIYYLHRENHIGSISVEDIGGLATVATSGRYSDLTGLPTFASVATTGSYTSLINRPTLGTASSYNVGTSAGNVVLLTTGGKLPAVDGSLLTNLPPTYVSPTTTKGDLIARGTSTDIRLPSGSSGQILSVDLTTPTNLKWIDPPSGGNAGTIDGYSAASLLSRTNHTGTQEASTITGLATVATSGSYLDLTNKPTLGTAASLNVGTGALSIVQLDSSARLPAVDGSLLTNLPSSYVSPTTTKGDLIARGASTDVRLPSGSSGQILSVDLTTPTNLKWIDPPDGGDADSLGGYSAASLLSRSSHTGTQAASTITGLSTVATSGSYLDLLNLPTLGSAASLNVGTSASNLVQLDSSTRLPAVDGSQLTNVNAALLDSNLPSYYLNRSNHTGTQSVNTITGLGTAATFNVGTSPLNLIQLDNLGRLPSVDGSLLTNLDTALTSFGGYTLAQILDRSYHTGTQLASTISNLGTAALLNIGTDEGEIPVLGVGGKLPSLDGSQLTNLALWNAPETKSTTFSAISLGKYFVDTSNGSFTVTLPPSGRVYLIDVTGYSPTTGFGQNALTISPTSGKTIMGSSILSLDIGAVSVVLELVGTDWRITSGGYT